MSNERLTWFKSSYSGGEGGDCVEVAIAPSTIHLRDSKNPTGPQLTLAPATWSAFLASGYCGNAATMPSS
ncbi:hypothetical protein BN159_3885 [Streptomyces davaonensis JCM 4913]|uniref:DUF397 domain-containing protein n=1 Tax=Streptomyces davaonensis (strain DSM 101723 / JCM 4913 / KCC S-0913 / 768) TaxID=1214101 RepID=K4R6C7_STRDJ|nr:DUF397 domain-containing protein [Streptomyces davaonensis]CCK28264.1 hypothetical protein BN159_3885 [Streptomyces davaonensis JCM 4913]